MDTGPGRPPVQRAADSVWNSGLAEEILLNVDFRIGIIRLLQGKILLPDGAADVRPEIDWLGTDFQITAVSGVADLGFEKCGTVGLAVEVFFPGRQVEISPRETRRRFMSKLR